MMHPTDPVCGDLLGAGSLALQIAAAAAEALGCHRRLHGG